MAKRTLTAVLARQALDRLSLRSQARATRRLEPYLTPRVKGWLGHHLTPIEQLALMDTDGLLSRHRPDGTQVLFWRGVPGRGSVYGEATIALALRLRGVGVRFVICDGVMSGCIQRTLEENVPVSDWTRRCPQCIRFGVRVLESLGVPYVGMGELVSPERRAELRRICDDLAPADLASYELAGVPVGQFAESSIQRYLGAEPLEGHESALREYLFSALVCHEAARNALDVLKPGRVFMQRHIEYVGWAPAYVVLTKAGLPGTLWGGAVVPTRRITLRNIADTDWRPLYLVSHAAWQQRSEQPLTEAQEEAVDAMLGGPHMARGYPVSSGCDDELPSMLHRPRGELLEELGVSDAKPIWCLFLHVPWDAGLSPQNLVFRDIFEWMVASVRAMLETDNVTWLLKVHPGEAGRTGPGAEEFLKERFPRAAERIRFIPVGSEITTTALCSVLAGGVTMRGTVGVQLPTRGIPVIVGERAHYAGRGFTHDGFTQERFLELIRQAGDIPALPDHQRDLAKRYAYLLLFQRSIPINMAQGRTGYAPLDPQELHLLFPGNDEVMDMLCDRVMNGGEFILDDPVAAGQV